MKRRNFIQTGALGAGALAVLGGKAWAGGGTGLEAASAPASASASDLPAPIAALRSRVAEAPSPITEAERVARRARARELMGAAGIDALFIEPGSSLGYFADLRWGRSERTFGLFLPREGEGVVVCPAFEQARAEKGVAGRFEIRVWQEDESPFELIGALMRERGRATGTLALEESTRYFVAAGIAGAVPALRVVSGDLVTHGCRGLKTAHEVEIMRFANQITVEAIEATFASLREGMTQAELSRLLRESFSRLGYAGGGLALIGESSAYPHGSDNPGSLREGDVVLVDVGTAVHGYASDISRTTVLGTPSAEVARVYAIVREAQAAALAAARPGRSCGELDEVARAVVERAGFGPDYKYFGHRLGHGIGLDGHEWPYLVRGSKVVLRPGMTFSNEPGIYQYGKFGMRIEDIMVITENGAEMLTAQAPVLA
jgi:Xaa-Pro dipeptidase